MISKKHGGKLALWERILRTGESGRSVLESHMIMNHDDPLGPVSR